MPTDPITVDQDRLRTVQRRVRELVLTHEPWLRKRFQKAFVDKLKLNSKQTNEANARWRRQWKMARSLLARGHLCDPLLKRNCETMIFYFEGVCPKGLATRLQAHFTAGEHAPQLSPEDVAEALIAFDLEMRYQIGRGSEEQRRGLAAERRLQEAAGAHVSFRWQFWLAKPSDWPEDSSASEPELSTLSEKDYFTVALYKLGGLADTDSQRPLIPKPRKGGGGIEYLLRYSAWKSRFPVARWGEAWQESELDVVQFPPHEAEQMLAVLEHWIRAEVTKRATSLPHGGAIVSPDLAVGRGRGVAVADPDSINAATENAKHERTSGATSKPDEAEGPRTTPKGHDDKHRWQRPVRISEAATVINMRGDKLLARLRKHGCPIRGARRMYSAELEHIISFYPRMRKRLTEWADSAYPAD